MYREAALFGAVSAAAGVLTVAVLAAIGYGLHALVRRDRPADSPEDPSAPHTSQES